MFLFGIDMCMYIFKVGVEPRANELRGQLIEAESEQRACSNAYIKYLSFG